MTIGEGLTVTDLAYAAALVDGEGCVGIKKSKGPRPTRISTEYRVYILVANTHLGVIEWLQNKFGGSIGMQKKGKCINGKERKLCYRWRIASRSAINFLKLIRPYMIIKSEQADICFMFQTSVKNIGGRRVVPEEVLRFRESCFQDNRYLNRKGA